MRWIKAEPQTLLEADYTDFRKGDRVIWNHKDGSKFLATITEAEYSGITIALDGYAQKLLENHELPHEVSGEELSVLFDERDIKEKTMDLQVKLIRLTENTCERHGHPLDGTQWLILNHVITHVMVQEGLGD